MDDAQRREQFIKWFDGPPMKSDREKLIRTTGYTKGRVSQLFDPNQPFGERAARSLAERLGMPAEFFNTAYAGVQEAFSTGGVHRTAHAAKEAARAPWQTSHEVTAATCTEWLGSYIGAADTLTRSQIAPLLVSLVDAPDRASELGARLQATLAMSPGYAPPALPGPGTTFAPPPTLPAVRHTPPEPKVDALDACVEHLAKALASAGPLQRQQANQALQMLANRPDDWRTVAALLRPLVTQM